MAEIFSRLISLRILPKVLCAPSLTAFVEWAKPVLSRASSREPRASGLLEARSLVSSMSIAVVAPSNPASQQAIHWLALGLTAGLGPTRIKKLIEHFGNAERVFNASLTELEATGMRAVSAQSIATGKSLELAQEECRKTVESGARIISLSDPEYPL